MAEEQQCFAQLSPQTYHHGVRARGSSEKVSGEKFRTLQSELLPAIHLAVFGANPVFRADSKFVDLCDSYHLICG